MDTYLFIEQKINFTYILLKIQAIGHYIAMYFYLLSDAFFQTITCTNLFSIFISCHRFILQTENSTNNEHRVMRMRKLLIFYAVVIGL